MRETIRYPLTGSDICDRGGRARNKGYFFASLSLILGSLAYVIPVEETRFIGPSLWFLSAVIAGMTYVDNESRIRIRDQELED